ncbi:uncharacterized protein TNCV_2350811 [Trichonephila clavipes]|uniref:Uncharacterized protein n=1 Tax=Trichonephila clavipes TaxID=2585209 RepID=A0A8X6SRR1_TRICX|nr:uncharacterized protein TNCV_2350811 [Trichonephila clavipes]
MFKIIFLIAAGIVIADAFDCKKDCKKVHCKPTNCAEDEMLVKNVLDCGCCDECRVIIKKGDPCDRYVYLGDRPSVCEEGTFCIYVPKKGSGRRNQGGTVCAPDRPEEDE